MSDFLKEIENLPEINRPYDLEGEDLKEWLVVVKYKRDNRLTQIEKLREVCVKRFGFTTRKGGIPSIRMFREWVSDRHFVDMLDDEE